jgi:hypothetical protein
MGMEAEIPASALGLFDIGGHGDKLTDLDVIDIGSAHLTVELMLRNQSPNKKVQSALAMQYGVLC